MPPTEAQILTRTLLPPSQLSSILPLSKFTSLFPSSLRSSPQIPILYRTLQLQRSLDLDAIKQNISAEAIRGREQVRALARQRALDTRSRGVDVGDVFVDGVGGTGGGGGNEVVGMGRKGFLDGRELCEGLEEVEGDLRAEVQRLEEEVRQMVIEAERIVDEMGSLEVDVMKELDVGQLIAALARITRHAGNTRQ